MIIILELLNSSTAVGVGDDVFSQRGFGSEISALVSFRVSHTGSPFALTFIHKLSSIQYIWLQGHVCSRKGGFHPESPNQLLDLQISVLLRNSGTILIISILLRHPVIIRSNRAHPEQLSAIPGLRGREQLPFWINSLACLETSETTHVPGILSGTGRLSVLQIGSFIGHLPH